MTTFAGALRTFRASLKSAVYSGPFRDRWQHPERVVAALDLEQGDRVADLGAGGGYFTYRLARAVGPEGRVYAVDPDGDMRTRIRTRAERKGYTNIETVDPDDDRPVLPAPVDVVLTVNAFHHLPEDRVGYFRELAGSLEPGGRVAVVEERPRWYLFGHATEPARIRATLDEAGYTLVEEDDFLPRQSFTVFQRPPPPRGSTT